MVRLFLFGNVSQEEESNSLPVGGQIAEGRMRITNDPGLVALCSVLLFIVIIFSALTPGVATVIANVHWHANC
jgi:hypothetical protein